MRVRALINVFRDGKNHRPGSDCAEFEVSAREGRALIARGLVALVEEPAASKPKRGSKPKAAAAEPEPKSDEGEVAKEDETGSQAGS